MTVQVLVATMGQNSLDFTDRMNLQSSTLVVNQRGIDLELIREEDQYRVQMVPSASKGLSRSRNLALLLSDAEICLIADDDLVYVEGYPALVKRAFSDHPDADVIAFQVQRTGGRHKKFREVAGKVGWMESLKISSVELAVRPSRIKASKVAFDERFGAGAEFPAGEENIFLFDSLRQGLKVYYVPKVIATVDMGESSWFTGFDEKYLECRGAIFYRMSRWLAPLLIAQFAVRKAGLFSHGILRSIMLMVRGAYVFRRANHGA